MLPWDKAGGLFARNTLWAFIGSGVSQASSLLAALMLGRMLGLSGFGQFALIQTTILLLGNLGEAGLTLTTTKFVGRWRTSDPARAGRLMVWALRVTAVAGVLMSVLLLLIGTYTDAFVPAIAPATFLAASALLIFDMLNRVQLGALAGLEAFRHTARIHLSRALLLLPSVWVGAVIAGLPGAVMAMAAVSLSTFMVGHHVLGVQCRTRAISLEQKSGFERGVVMTSASLWMSTLLLTGSTWIVTLQLSHQASGLEELGLFSAADRWKIALLFLPNVLFQVILPMLARSRAEGNHRACSQMISTAMLSTAGITGTAALAVFLMSPMLMSWYGSSFQAGAGVLGLAALGSIAGAIYTVGSGVLWSLGKPSQMFGIDLFRTILLLALCFTGLGDTAWDVMLAYLLAYTAGCAVVMAFVHRQLRTDQNHANYAR